MRRVRNVGKNLLLFRVLWVLDRKRGVRPSVRCDVLLQGPTDGDIVSFSAEHASIRKAHRVCPSSLAFVTRRQGFSGSMRFKRPSLYEEAAGAFSGVTLWTVPLAEASLSADDGEIGTEDMMQNQERDERVVDRGGGKGR
jgi:hypothetical protein